MWYLHGIYTHTEDQCQQSLASEWEDDYRKVSNIRRTKFQSISDSRTVLHVVFAQSIEAMY